MKLALFLILPFLQGFTCGLSRHGDFLATTGNGGVIRTTGETHGAAIIDLRGGNAATNRQLVEVEAGRPGFLNIGGPEGITLSGTWANNDPTRSIMGFLRDTAKIKTSGDVAKDLIKNTADVIQNE